MPRVMASVTEEELHKLKEIKKLVGMRQQDVAGIAIRLALSDTDVLAQEIIDQKKMEIREVAEEAGVTNEEADLWS